MTTSRQGAYFGYFIGDRTPIHNANMLVCGLLARLSRVVDRPDFRQACSAGVRYCLSHQRSDGSWPYGETPGLGWVDGFHTGYVLEALLECEQADISEAVGHSLDRGLAFYRSNLFRDDGTPKYYASKTYPIDAQSAAQGIQILRALPARGPTISHRPCVSSTTRCATSDGEMGHFSFSAADSGSTRPHT